MNGYTIFEANICISRWEDGQPFLDTYKIKNMTREVNLLLGEVEEYDYIEIKNLGLLLVKDVWIYKGGLSFNCKKVNKKNIEWS
jgi:hypothetical protein